MEQSGEDIEKVTIDTLQKELDLDFENSDIDIVHRVGVVMPMYLKRY